MKGSSSSIAFIFKTLSFLFFFNFIVKDVFATPSKHFCHLEQRGALIKLKHEFKISKPCDHEDGFPKMESWTNKSDCCFWDGITCDANFGNVIKLDLSLSCLSGQLNSKSNIFKLQSLRLLYLSFNNFIGPIPSSIANLSKLTTLDLSSNHFNGQIPSSLAYLSKLTYLDLSYNNFIGPIPSSIANLSKLTTLSLHSNNFNGQIPSLANLSKLTTLTLHSNNFNGEIPSSLANLSKLTYLDLSSNHFNGQIPSSLAYLSKLTYLDLSHNNFNGKIPSDFGRLNELVELDLSSNKLNGNFPLSVLNLTNVSSLSLYSNQLTGTLPPNISSLSNLGGFDASDNAFTGNLPSSLFDIPSLSEIYLGDNQLNGTLDFGNLSSPLEALYLGKNKLRGPIPRSITKLVNLERLDLSYLKIQGSIDFSIFLQFKSLEALYLSHLNTTTILDLNEIFSCFKYLQELDLSGNHVSFDIKSPVSNHPLLTEVHFSHCGLTKFPEFIRTQYEIEKLNISNNEIKGGVPGWLWLLPNLTYVNLSSNKFVGFERSMNPKLSSTKESQMIYLFGANNDFLGNIPPFICAYRGLYVLDLSNNKFNGSIPSCLGNFSTYLKVLNLRKNHLSGGLPKNISKSLVSLDIGHNQLVGKLPRSLVHISSLEVLNVESNKFNDTFPFWLSSLQELQVLVLRSNAFHGPIQKVGFSKLRIIDISNNHFNGTLPSDCFVNWTTMCSFGITEDKLKRKMGTRYYTDSLVLMNKGTKMELVQILKIITAVDFSGNKFEGEIPSSIGLLKELIVLNFSKNAFIGNIPSTMEDLRALESLDVSKNKLSGEIPQGLGKLSFVSYMDFSHNQLVGPVPEGTQFQTQNCSSFEPNRGLFGPTLETVCGDMHKKTSQQSEMREQREDEEEMISWRAAAIGFIPGIVFGFTMGFILLSHKPKLFIKNFGRNRRCRPSTTTH